MQTETRPTPCQYDAQFVPGATCHKWAHSERGVQLTDLNAAQIGRSILIRSDPSRPLMMTIDGDIPSIWLLFLNNGTDRYDIPLDGERAQLIVPLVRHDRDVQLISADPAPVKDVFSSYLQLAKIALLWGLPASTYALLSLRSKPGKGIDRVSLSRRDFLTSLMIFGAGTAAGYLLRNIYGKRAVEEIMTECHRNDDIIGTVPGAKLVGRNALVGHKISHIDRDNPTAAKNIHVILGGIHFEQNTLAGTHQAMRDPDLAYRALVLASLLETRESILPQEYKVLLLATTAFSAITSVLSRPSIKGDQLVLTAQRGTDGNYFRYHPELAPSKLTAAMPSRPTDMDLWEASQRYASQVLTDGNLM